MRFMVADRWKYAMQAPAASVAADENIALSEIGIY